MFNFLKKTFGSIYQQCTTKLRAIFSRTHIDQEALTELEKILITADTGIHTTRTIINNLKMDLQNGTIDKGSDLEHALGQQLEKLLAGHTYTVQADVFLLVGINGSGKTTFAGKLGLFLQKLHKTVLFVAGDTFRAAAVQQLTVWAHKLKSDIVTGKPDQDPASVVFTGCQQFKSGQYSSLIIDTAGRLQTKVNLMKELEKIKKIIAAQLPDKKIATLLIIDTMLGQNSFDQAKMFNESTRLDGIVLTKMDGTGKGGIVFSIVQELKIPIAFIAHGEQPEQLKIFNAQEYINQLLKEE